MITYLITGITVVVSFICFNNRLLFDKLSLKPYRIVHAKEWYRNRIASGEAELRAIKEKITRISLFMQTGCIYS